MLSLSRTGFSASGLYTRRISYTSRRFICNTKVNPRKNDAERENLHHLSVYNSLTKSKSPIESSNGKPLKWYSCGPTVYDSSHLGHARNYVSQDVIRRILVDYFGYDVHLVMNVTDIDDKIIARTRERFFTERFAAERDELSHDLISKMTEMLQAFVWTRIIGSLPQDVVQNEGVDQHWTRIFSLLDSPSSSSTVGNLLRDEKVRSFLLSAKRCFDAISNGRSRLEDGFIGKDSVSELIDGSKDVLGIMLNEKFHSETIDPALYKRTADLWESRFFRDMSRLHVLPPDTVTRASEYVPEIIKFVQGILDKGYAYSSNGSVYFDTCAFRAGDGRYGKLVPVDKTQEETRAGVVHPYIGDKKSISDFSLWKAAKLGEPSWSSPWGPGRPGWHIECSAMASSIFGDHLHIHSGGIDLMFPHHTNELAQSEAYHSCEEWVDCFIHVGHLHIDGLKMSKSLKNFITIDELLRKYTSRQIRLAFLLRSWNTRMDFSDNVMQDEVLPLEMSINNFFSHVGSLTISKETFKTGCPSGARERDLRLKFDQAKAMFRMALCDSMNTPSALNAIRNLITQCNIYINQTGTHVDGLLVLGIATWVAKMLRMFGLDQKDTAKIGWDISPSPGRSATDNSTILPYLQALSSFRDDVRAIAKKPSPEMTQELLTLCDKLRGDVLPPLGVQLSDRAAGPALIKFVSPNTSPSKEAKIPMPERRSEGILDSKSNLSPYEMFKPPHDGGRYGSWDDLGIPLTDAQGDNLSKNHRKKLQKAWNKRKAVYNGQEKAN